MATASIKFRFLSSDPPWIASTGAVGGIGCVPSYIFPSLDCVVAVSFTAANCVVPFAYSTSACVPA